MQMGTEVGTLEVDYKRIEEVKDELKNEIDNLNSKGNTNNIKYPELGLMILSVIIVLIFLTDFKMISQRYHHRRRSTVQYFTFNRILTFSGAVQTRRGRRGRVGFLLLW